ncbi:MAG: glutamine amidotransferase [Planctomycetota bacterium]
MNTKSVATNLYRNFRPCEDMKNKAKTNPIKPKKTATALVPACFQQPVLAFIVKISAKAFCLERGQLNGIFVPMKTPILYLGDTSLKEAGSYLAGVMSYYKLNFDYLASGEKFNNSLFDNNYSTIIISDYPAKNFTQDQLKILAEKIQHGMGLLMIGGWESFTGANCEYNDTISSEILPVIMKNSDDRVNCPQPCLIKKTTEHEIIKSLPFDENPPCIGGFNQFQAKPQSQTILSVCRFNVCYEADGFKFHPFEKTDPLLVLGSYGKAKICALATDAAPHWVGGLVDWGNSRIEAKADGANQIEVGNWYAEFLANIIKWTMGRS